MELYLGPQHDASLAEKMKDMYIVTIITTACITYGQSVAPGSSDGSFDEPDGEQDNTTQRAPSELDLGEGGKVGEQRPPSRLWRRRVLVRSRSPKTRSIGGSDCAQADTQTTTFGISVGKICREKTIGGSGLLCAGGHTQPIHEHPSGKPFKA